MQKSQVISFCLLFSLANLFGQSDYNIKLKAGHLELSRNTANLSFEDKEYENYQADGYFYLITQFDQIPTEKQIDDLEERGIYLLSYIPNYAYITKVPIEAFEDKEFWKTHVRHLSPYLPEYKLPSNLSEAPDNCYLQILFHETVSDLDAQKILQGKFISWDRSNKDGRLFKIQVEKSTIEAIAEIPQVNYISITSKNFDPLIEECKETGRVGQAKHATGLNLSGNGVTLSVGDGGTIFDHADLNDRIQNENNVDVSGHGSQTTGIIAAEGIIDPAAAGFAPSANIYADYFGNVITSDDTYFNNFGVVISNNSYANGIVSNLCNEAGEYTSASASIDESLRTLNEVVHVFAVGNDGAQTCSTFPTGYATIRNAYNSSKNALCVGATDYLDNIAGYSSRGPVQDGRLKPEIVAVGSDVYSTRTDNDYASGSGTSYSCPSVAGGMALLYEYYKSLNGGSNPNGDLMKAVISNTARDLGNPGPDFIYGFGAMDIYRATKTLTDGNYLIGSTSDGITNNHNIVIPAGINQVKVMLYWHDVGGAAAASPALVNNLDLTLTDPSTMTSLPLVLDPSPANCANTATEGTDALNNIEQIVIDNPAAGIYTVNVAGTSVPMGSQDYVIVFDLIENHLALSSPMGGEFYIGGESVNITWNAAGFDTNSFTLEYSLNNGTNWTTISSSISGTDRNYEWTVPNTYTNEGLIRITWNSTGLVSNQSLSNFTIMDAPSNFSAVAECNLQATLSWTALAGASSYDVLEYTGGTWSVLTNTTSTSHTTTSLSGGTTYYYSVRANTASGIVGPNALGKKVVAKGSAGGSISNFPYLEDFEATNGDWATTGKNSTWAWGSPSSTLISRAAKGSKCWATNLTGDYNNAENSYLVSPCFDLSTMTSPELTFAFIRDIEDADDGGGNQFYDYARVQYSTDGTNWTTLGNTSSGHNWYNNYMGNAMWDDTKAYWHSVTYGIPSTASEVTFRIVFDSDGFTSQEGIGIDNIMIYESKEIYNSTNTSLTENLSGNDWIDFESGGQLVLSINPNGNNMGSTTADVYINSSAVRDNGTQYYLDRNWHISPTTGPSSDVSVRLYLLDSEVEALRTASGCGSCTTITDAFMSGITKYSGANENGVLTDNEATSYAFFDPSTVDLIPYENGYYLEFDTPNFSEFYLNGGGVAMNSPLPVELLNFSVSKNRGTALLKWETASELNSAYFQIQLAEGRNNLRDNNFKSIGSIAAKGNSDFLNKYEFIDQAPNKVGERYYRLKIVDQDGSYEYSPIRLLDFGNVFSVSIYPNPSWGDFDFHVNVEQTSTGILLISNQLGQLIFEKRIEFESGKNNLTRFITNLRLDNGLYHVALLLNGEQINEKLLILKE